MIQFQFIRQASIAIKIICVEQKAEPGIDEWSLEDQAQAVTYVTGSIRATLTISYSNNIFVNPKVKSHLYFAPIVSVGCFKGHRFDSSHLQSTC